MTRRSLVIAIASLATHAAMLVILGVLPSPEPPERGIEYAPIEVITLAPPGAPVPTPSEPSPEIAPPPAPTPADPSAPPEPASREPSKPRARGPASEAPPSTAPPATTTPPPVPDAPAAPTGPSAPALALEGLRGSSKIALTSPRLTDDARRGMLVPEGPEPPPSSGGGGGGGSGGGGSGNDAGFVRNKKGELVYTPPGGQFVAKLLPDGRVHFKDKLISTGGSGVKAPDLYTVVTKARKQELWAREKTEFLKRTFEFRLAIAVAFAETQIDRRVKALYRDLVDIWSEDEQPAVARRKTIFKRWDECEENLKLALPGFEGTEDSRIDKLRQSAGEKARAQIVAFVRRHVPKDSPDAYTPAELAELNRGRRSKEKFAPYEDAN